MKKILLSILFIVSFTIILTWQNPAFAEREIIYTPPNGQQTIIQNPPLSYDNNVPQVNAQTPGGTQGYWDGNTFHPLIELGGDTGTQQQPPQNTNATGVPNTNTPTSPPAQQKTIFGAVFEDKNKNCVFDSGERLLDNWAINRGWAAQVDQNGNSVPGACWTNAGTTATISEDVNYRMTFNPNNSPACNGGNLTLPFQINASDPETGWQPSSQSCGVQGYVTNALTWFRTVNNIPTNDLRIDFPMLKPQQIACGTTCTSQSDCATATLGCNQCLPNSNGQGFSCQEPPTISCNSTCTLSSDCTGSREGCTTCVTGSNGQKTCQQPPSCGTTCTLASDCAGARNGCTSCVPDSDGQGSSCQQPPSCGTACDRNDSSACSGLRTSAGGDCSSCRPNSAGNDVCQPPEIACGSACDRNDSSACAGVRTSSGGDCSACLPNAGGTDVCQPPISCNSACVLDSDCAGARNGCTACVEGEDGNKTCQEPPSCGTTCTQASDCAGARNGCTACVPDSDGQGSSCQTPPSCGSACARDDQCTGARNSAGQNCSDCRPNANGQNICQTEVACNSACTKDSDCDAGDAKAQGCIKCLPGSNGQLTCQKNIACNSACTKDSDCNAGDALRDGCTSCIANKCQTFNEDMCKCDGITFTQIASGQEVTVTNFEKVEGPNIMKAKVQDMTFFFTEGRGANAPIIAKSQPIKATIVSQTTDKVRYQSQWKVKVPENVKPGVDYQIFAQVKCVKQSELAMASTNQAVLAETTSNQGFFERIGAFFSRLFGGGQTSIQSTAPTATNTPTTNPNRESLQLRSFNPNVNVDASCRFVKFNFKE